MTAAEIQPRQNLATRGKEDLSFIFILAVLLLLSGKKHNDPENDSERNAFVLVFNRFAGLKASIFGSE
jgi:hypothetical protein